MQRIGKLDCFNYDGKLLRKKGGGGGGGDGVPITREA